MVATQTDGRFGLEMVNSGGTGSPSLVVSLVQFLPLPQVCFAYTKKKKKNLASNPGWEINPARQRSPAPVQGHAQQYQEAPTHSLAAFAVGSVLLSSALVSFLFLTELKMLS